ncbi:MAG: barstar family protein [Candidatus Omnitrophota bacterium]
MDGNAIKDWDSFHDVFTEVFGFPDCYGRNMDAWIIRMMSIDDPDSSLTTVKVSEGENLTLEILNGGSLRKRCPEILDTLSNSLSLVDFRRIGAGKDPVLSLWYSI